MGQRGATAAAREALCRAAQRLPAYRGVMVPTMLVPLYLLIHLTIAVKLRSWRPTTYRPALDPDVRPMSQKMGHLAHGPFARAGPLFPQATREVF
jgi:hypothetical protein